MRNMEMEIERRGVTYSQWKSTYQHTLDQRGWHPITFHAAKTTLQAIKDIQVGTTNCRDHIFLLHEIFLYYSELYMDDEAHWFIVCLFNAIPHSFNFRWLHTYQQHVDSPTTGDMIHRQLTSDLTMSDGVRVVVRTLRRFISWQRHDVSVVALVTKNSLATYLRGNSPEVLVFAFWSWHLSMSIELFPFYHYRHDKVVCHDLPVRWMTECLKVL